MDRFRLHGGGSPERALLAACLLLSATLAACRQPETSTSSWLGDDADERFETIARHFRGLDVAMIETGYRFTR